MNNFGLFNSKQSLINIDTLKDYNFINNIKND